MKGQSRLNLKCNYQKFKRHLKVKGIFYAFWRGIKYLIFLIKKSTDKPPPPHKSIKPPPPHKSIKPLSFTFDFRKIKDNYLDIMGVFSKKFALKGPHSVQIDLTNKCNNNCIACWCNSYLFPEKRNDEQSLSYEKVFLLIDMLKKMGTKEIYLAGGGEPFMYPQILEVIKHIKKRGFICSLNTNFTLVDDAMIQELLKLRLNYLIVSIWAGTHQVYKDAHPGKDERTFYRIGQMLKFLGEIKRETPYVCINNVIFNGNYKDMENMVNFALEVNADAVNFAVVDVLPGFTDKLLLNEIQRQEVLGTIKRIMSRKEVKRKIDFWSIERFIERMSNSFSNEGNYDKGLIDNIPCYTGWLFSRILANGDVNACLKAHRIPVGNIYKQSFKKIWNSQNQQEFRNRSCVIGRQDPFFAYIGNNPEIRDAGCYRSCDDFKRNLIMDRRIKSLSFLEKKLCRAGGRFLNLIKREKK